MITTHWLNSTEISGALRSLMVVAAALREAGAAVEVHDDHFPQGAPDTVWLEAVGRKGWVVPTKDERIRYRDAERKALLTAGVRAFVLTAKDLSRPALANVFLQALPAMRRLLA
ncbi:MAG: hypothetical protein ACT4NU_12420 [Chromatiales bacterium]